PMWRRFAGYNWPECLANASQLLNRQERIHRTRTEAFQIERDKLKSKRFEDPAELGSHFWRQGPREFILGNFDSDNLAVIADAELAKAETAEGVLTSFDHADCLPSDRTAVFDA